MADILLVGEAPGAKGAQPSDGWHTRIGFIRSKRVNLLTEWPGVQGKGSAFPATEARPMANLLIQTSPQYMRFVIMGRAAWAFSLPKGLEYFEWTELSGRYVCICPHPSGINRWWNEESNRNKAVKFFEDLKILEPEHKGSYGNCKFDHGR